MCHCVWSRNLKNEEAMARVGPHHHRGKKKVKCTLVQALRLCTGRMAHRRSRGIALLFLDHGTRTGWVVSRMPRPHFTPGKDPVPIVQEAGWAPGPVWTGAGNLAPTGIRSRTVQPVTSRYTDYAARPTLFIILFFINRSHMFQCQRVILGELSLGAC